MADHEERAGCELRAVGRSLSGPAMPYGEVSPGHRERFEPGAFAPIATVPLRLQHDPAIQILAPGEFELIDTPAALEVRAELPPTSAAVRLVAAGALAGWSVGFHSRSERREAGVRVIERAELTEISLLSAGAYPGARPELRHAPDRRRRWWA